MAPSDEDGRKQRQERDDTERTKEQRRLEKALLSDNSLHQHEYDGEMQGGKAHQNGMLIMPVRRSKRQYSQGMDQHRGSLRTAGTRPAGRVPHAQCDGQGAAGILSGIPMPVDHHFAHRGWDSPSNGEGFLVILRRHGAQSCRFISTRKPGLAIGLDANISSAMTAEGKIRRFEPAKAQDRVDPVLIVMVAENTVGRQ
jgi:hypothetical protein